MSDERLITPGQVMPRVSRPGELLWECWKDQRMWSAELRFFGERLGWEAGIRRDGELVMSYRFMLREHATRWAHAQQRFIQRGWIDG